MKHMTSIYLFLLTLAKTIFFIATNEIPFARLGENCLDDLQCEQQDSNSVCPTVKDQRYRLEYICTCKLNYHIEIINSTKKCIYGEPPEEEKEGLTAAPIILCFMGCVIIEAFCLFAFRYWKKRRRTSFTQHHTLSLEAVQFVDTRIIHPTRSRALVSFMITSQVDNSTSGAGASSPPSYSQAGMADVSTTQSEEPPPTYEEAMKHFEGSSTQTDTDTSKKSSERKMSC